MYIRDPSPSLSFQLLLALLLLITSPECVGSFHLFFHKTNLFYFILGEAGSNKGFSYNKASAGEGVASGPLPPSPGGRGSYDWQQ